METTEQVTLVIESRSSRDTKTWGRRLASILEGGELLAFVGELGVGKTCFIKGLADGLSLPEEQILSPFIVSSTWRWMISVCANTCSRTQSRRSNGSNGCVKRGTSSVSRFRSIMPGPIAAGSNSRRLATVMLQ